MHEVRKARGRRMRAWPGGGATRVIGVGVVSIALVLIAGIWGPLACQKVSEPMPVLTQNQWQRVADHILDEVPEIEHPVGAIFDGKIEFLGFDIEPDVAETGGEVTITWYWRCIEAVDDDWQIFVHLDRGNQRQNLDHKAIGGLYDTRYWEAGQIIRDIQRERLDPGIGSGQVQMYVGFWRPSDESRLPISRAGNAVVQEDGRVMVGSFESRQRRLVLEAQARSRDITIDGSLGEADWRRAPQSDAFVSPNDGGEIEGSATQARALWDNEALYVGLTATDTDIWSTYDEDDTNLWDEEVLEVYLDPLGDGRNYLEIQINPLGAVFDALFEQAEGRDPAAIQEREFDIPGMQAEVSLNPRDALDARDNRDRRWTAELRIPWASIPDMGDQVESGATLRANFYRYDRPSDDQTIYSAWSPIFGGSFHQPDKFGEIRLVGEPPGAEAPAGTGEGTGRAARGGAAEGTAEGTGIRSLRDIRRVEGRTLQLRQPVIPEALRPVGTSIQR